MRIDRALENIRAVMESQEIDWLSSNGFDPVPHKPEPRRPSAPKKALSGHFAANRFLGTASTEPIEPEDAPVHDSTPDSSTYAESHDFATSSSHMLGEVRRGSARDDLTPGPSPYAGDGSPLSSTEPEFVEVIKQKDNKHSWLYNEVVKAIRDASGDGRNTKVIAIFVPVVQNGKEFEDLPVSEIVELSPVDEDAVKIEELPSVAEAFSEPEAEPAEHVDEIFPEPMHEPDPELAQAFENIEVKPDDDVQAEPEEAPEVEEITANEPETIPDSEGAELEELPMREIEPLDVHEDDTPQETNNEEISEPLDINVDENPEEFSAGEKLEYTEIPLPDELDDDEVLDEENKN